MAAGAAVKRIITIIMVDRAVRTLTDMSVYLTVKETRWTRPVLIAVKYVVQQASRFLGVSKSINTDLEH